jgi:hypothetical protein
MAQCDLLGTCIFFNDKMVNYPAASEFLKKKHCLSDPDSCARLIVVKAIGRPNVPADLFPNDAERAKKLIAAHKG